MTDQQDIVFSADQQEGTEAVLAQWLKAPGEPVKAHEPVAEIETDKVMVEVAAPADGVIIELKIEQGQPVHPGDVLCTYHAGGEAAPEALAEAESAGPLPQPIRSVRRRLSPAVRHKLMEHNLDADAIAGSGRDGRITLRDVKAYLETLSEQPSQPTDAARPKTAAAVVGSTERAQQASVPAGQSRKVPHDTMRRRIAEHMVTSLLHTAPHVTAVFEVDLSRIGRHRAARKADYAARGTPLTYTAYFVAAAVAAIERVPEVNSRWHEDHLEIFGDINIGVGTALGDEGLIVPVIRRANDKNLRGIAADLADLTTRARQRKLSPEDVRGGTFTISNHGVSGSLFAAPVIINQPQSAILGIGKIEKRIKVIEVDGEDHTAIRPMCYVSLTIDHRVLDGHQTNSFLSAFCSALENWPG